MVTTKDIRDRPRDRPQMKPVRYSEEDWSRLPGPSTSIKRRVHEKRIQNTEERRERNPISSTAEGGSMQVRMVRGQGE